jgi:hypothetical protein
MYTPINGDVYTLAYTGALNGMAQAGRAGTSANVEEYNPFAVAASAWAQQFDTLFNSATALNEVQATLILNGSFGYWGVAQRTAAVMASSLALALDPLTYAPNIQPILATITAALENFELLEITPPPWGGSGTPFTPGGDLRGTATDQIVQGLQTVPLSTATPTTGQTWIFNGTEWAPAAVPAGPSVTGTGLWYSAGGTLNGAAVSLGGDVSPSALSGDTLPLTVVGLQTIPVSATAPTTAGQLLVYSGAAWGPSTLAAGEVLYGAAAGGAVAQAADFTWSESAQTLSLGAAGIVGSGGQTQVQVSGVTALQMGYATTDFLALGGPASGTGGVAQSGFFRAAQNLQILAARNGGNNGDINLLGLDSGNDMYVGSAGGGVNLAANLALDATESVIIRPLNSYYFGIYLSQSLLTNATSLQPQSVSSFILVPDANTPACNVSLQAGPPAGSDANGATLATLGGVPTGSGLAGRNQMWLGSSDLLVECAEPATGQRVLALLADAPVTTADLPAGTGDLVAFLGNCATLPTANPVGGGLLYVNAGILTYRSPGGTVTVIAPN